MYYKYLIIISVLLTYISCEEFLEVDDPKGQLSSTTIFNNEQTAQAALQSIYSDLRNSSSLSGGFNGNSFIYGIYSDELDFYALSNQPNYAVYLHQILPSNGAIKDLWSRAYQIIYACNAFLEGVDTSTSISEDKKTILKGEVLFIRSILHYNLAQSFGDVPYITTTEYSHNSRLIKSPYKEVINQVIKDLQLAKNVMGNENILLKNRANKFVIAATLARIYLYKKDWGNAINESEEVLFSGNYQLESDLSKEFIVNSSSTIFHLPSRNTNENSSEASIYLFDVGPPNNASLNEHFVESFHQTDQRKHHWIRSVFSQNKFWYMPHKYKERNPTSPAKEYTVVFRLAEQYLIHAEANWHLNNRQNALLSINKIRTRAGMNPITDEHYSDFLDFLKYERQHELFLEQGNRWFDLKRWGAVAEVLSPLKPGWNSKSLLFPIPESEILINPNLLPQNEGYN